MESTAADTARVVAPDVAVNSDLGALLGELPLPSGAASAGDPVVKGDTIEQTYTVTGEGARSVIADVYEPSLAAAGWEAVTGAVTRGDGFTQTWTRDNVRLELVSAPGEAPETTTVDVLLARQP